MPIRTLADVEAAERTPFDMRVPETNVFDLLRGAAERHPERTALVFLEGADAGDPHRRILYPELMKRILQSANLFSSLGVGPGDTVTLLMPGVPETFFTLFGAEIAAVANPVNYFLEPAQIAAIMREAGAKALVACDPSVLPDIWSKVERIREMLPDVTVVRVGGGPSGHPGTVHWDSAIAGLPGDRLVAPRAFDRSTLAALFHTGGTTGLPKLARHTHGALALMAWTNRALLSDGIETIVNGLPQFHVGGALMGGLAPFSAGWTVVLPTALGARNPNTVRNYWRIAAEWRVTMAAGVPTSLAAALNAPRDGLDLSALRMFVTGGSTVPVELARRLERELGIKPIEGYGMTEVHCYSSINPAEGEVRVGSVGLRVPYMKIRIADVAPDGEIRRDCATGEVGHVLMRGPQVTPGYLDPAHNRGAMLADGWLDSGDLGRFDAEGYLWIVGRSKDLIIRGGHNIDPLTIEDAMARHPAVENVAAVGRPDSYAGELPVVFVQLRPGAAATPEELLAFGRAHVPERAAAPVEAIVLETMPLTGVGKIFKPALRLTAARRVFDAALEPLRTKGVAASVEVAAHPSLGTLATVTVPAAAPLPAAEIDRICAELLGGFQIKHAVMRS